MHLQLSLLNCLQSNPLRVKKQIRESRVVTKKEIVKTISEQCELTQLKTKEIVQKTFEAIIDTLVKEERIELRNFGVFEVKKRAARKARNPRSGERVDVPEKWVVTFKPGKEMEEKVLQLEQKKAAENAVTTLPPTSASISSETSAPSMPGQPIENSPSPFQSGPDSPSE